MNKPSLLFLLTLFALTLCAKELAAAPADFAGEYANKNFLNGQAVFQMRLEQHGNTISIWFSAGYDDGHAAAPEADGSGKLTGKGTVEFKFEDSFNNVGTGTIVHSGQDVVVSLKMTRVVDSRCLAFYGQNIRLKPVKK